MKSRAYFAKQSSPAPGPQASLQSLLISCRTCPSMGTSVQELRPSVPGWQSHPDACSRSSEACQRASSRCLSKERVGPTLFSRINTPSELKYHRGPLRTAHKHVSFLTRLWHFCILGMNYSHCIYIRLRLLSRDDDWMPSK